MTLFWCEIHDASAPHKTAHCWYAVAKANDRSGWGAGECRVVERRLVALDGIDEVPIAFCVRHGTWAHYFDLDDCWLFTDQPVDTDACEIVRSWSEIARVLAALDQEDTP